MTDKCIYCHPELDSCWKVRITRDKLKDILRSNWRAYIKKFTNIVCFEPKFTVPHIEIPFMEDHPVQEISEDSVMLETPMYYKLTLHRDSWQKDYDYVANIAVIIEFSWNEFVDAMIAKVNKQGIYVEGAVNQRQ